MKENFDRLRAVSGVLVVIVVTCAVACQQRSASTSGKIRPIRLTTSVPLSYANIVDHVAPAVVAGHSARRVKAPEQFPFLEDPFLLCRRTGSP